MLLKPLIPVLELAATAFSKIGLWASENQYFGFSTSTIGYSEAKLSDVYQLPLEITDSEFASVSSVALLGASDIQKLERTLKRELGIESTEIKLTKFNEINVQVTPNKKTLVINGSMGISISDIETGDIIEQGKIVEAGSYEIYKVEIRLRDIDLVKAKHTKEKLANGEEKSFFQTRSMLGAMFETCVAGAKILSEAKGESPYHDVDLTPEQLTKLQSQRPDFSYTPKQDEKPSYKGR